MNPHRAARRRGSILVLALLASAAASIAGMWLITTSDLRVRANRYLVIASDASRIATSGLQFARIQLDRNMGWSGANIATPIDGWSGRMLIASQPTTWSCAHVSITGFLNSGQQSVHANLRAVPHPTLDYNFASGTTVTFTDAVVAGRFRANGAVNCVGNVDFSGVITTPSGSSVSGQIDSTQVVYAQSALSQPTVSLSTYQSISSPMLGVPRQPGNGPYLFDHVSLTPSANPYGGTNASGAYLFDAGGANVTIQDVYLRGTLTILNAGTVQVGNGFNADRVDASLATIVVQGAIDMHLETDLNETYLLTDLNGDGDMLDVFTPQVTGLVFATGDFKGTYGGRINGSVLAHAIEIVGNCDVGECASLLTQPVREFITHGPWEIVVGSIGSGT